MESETEKQRLYDALRLTGPACVLDRRNGYCVEMSAGLSPATHDALIGGGWMDALMPGERERVLAWLKDNVTVIEYETAGCSEDLPLGTVLRIVLARQNFGPHAVCAVEFEAVGSQNTDEPLPQPIAPEHAYKD